MKRNIKFNILGWLAAAALLLTTSCTDTLSEVFGGGEYETVTFTIMPETANGLATRVKSDSDVESKVPYGEGSHISDGTKADMLIYAVYEWDGKEATLLTDYAEGAKDADLQDRCGDGQTIIKLGDYERFPIEVTLKVKRNKTYKVAFWAQSSNCDAYSTEDLTRVEMKYSQGANEDAPNNDELRDAFCKVETIVVDKNMKTDRIIYLYRPLAQINVGTSGYDYESVVRDKEWKYAYTSVQFVKAARYLNVVTDQIVSTENQENASVVNYGYARIPAYINYKGDDLQEILTTPIDNEEFLKVHLRDDDDDSDTYMDDLDADGFSDYANLTNGDKKTETFKYLSMSYVLVPSETTYGEEKNTYAKTSLERVRVWIATDDKNSNEVKIIDLENVPVQRNYRTNIVGNILTTDVNVNVVLDPMYAGDYNGFYKDGGESVEWSGPLADGVSYDAEKDEILISNVNGLLWLQQMVNGDLVYTKDVTRSIGTSVSVGTPIQYYDEKHKNDEDINTCSHTFVEDKAPSYFKGIPDPTKDLSEGDDGYKEAAELKARILRATHQDKRKSGNDGWPDNNNFHFVGASEDDRANVKLMADIDLSGIEWLGIGFDCKMDQTADMLCDNNEEKSETTYEIYDKTKHRGFFGHFDGNGHTVSNLTTKRFSMDVHPTSYQTGSGGPFEAVQWYARGFFGQLGGAAIVENLTLRNVDIRGFHCVGGIAGAAIGVDEKNKKGREIVIRNCVVDGGYIENVPMYRGDVTNSDKNRTWSRGVNTGGIVGLYNASGSIEGCRVSNLTINAYRVVGGIVGCIDHYYLAYPKEGDFTQSRQTFPDQKNSPDYNSVRPSSIKNNSINNTVIIADHFKPFETPYHGSYKKNGCDIDWAYGFSWNPTYQTYVDYLAGGENGVQYVETSEEPDLSDVQLINLAGDTKGISRTTDLDNVPVNLLPIMDNWFIDDVQVKSNLIGEAAAYKRYKTTDFAFYSSTPDTKQKSPFPMFTSYDRDWVKRSGRVGMYVGAITLTGNSHVLSVREVTNEKDCAVLITACDRKQFTGKGDDDVWYKSAETTFSGLSVRGNPYAYTGICLSPNERMSKITIDNVAVYDVYQTIALAKLKEAEDGVWPLAVDASSVYLEVKNSNLRGYTVPGEGWNSIEYVNVVFEKGARILSKDNADLETEYTCKVEAKTNFKGCTFKAPFIIEIESDVTVDFDKSCTATYAGVPIKDFDPSRAKSAKKIEITATGKVIYDNK